MSKKWIVAGGLCMVLIAAVTLAVLASMLGEVSPSTENAITTPSGLKYVELKLGEGKEAKLGSTVMVYYTGTLEDGKKFDSNVGKRPYEVTIGKTMVIQGWTEGLQGMKAGGRETDYSAGTRLW